VKEQAACRLKKLAILCKPVTKNIDLIIAVIHDRNFLKFDKLT